MAFPTEDEFEHQRRVIRARYPQLFEAIETELRYVDEHLEGLMPKPPSKFDLALAAHLARASKTTLGIFRLCEHGFGELAMGALRNLGETMVSAYWMSLDKDARADQFEKWAELEAIETKAFVEKMGWKVEIPANLHDEKWVAEVEAQFPRRIYGWMQERMDRIVRDVRTCWPEGAAEKEFDPIMELLRAFGDQHSHVGTGDTVRYLQVADERRLAVHLGPGKRWVPQALFPTAWVYGQVFDLVAETWGLEDLENWRAKFTLLLARTFPLKAEAARGVGRNDPCPCGSGLKFKRCHIDLVAS
jgi:hypothetical protein